MADNTVLIRFDADYKRVVAATNALVKQFKLMNQELVAIGEGSGADRFAKQAQKMASESRKAQKEITLLLNNLKILEQVQAKMTPGAKTIRRDRLTPAEGFLVGEGTESRIPVADINAQHKATFAELSRLLADYKSKSIQGEREIAAIMAQRPELAQKLISFAAQEQFIKQRTARFLSGQVEAQQLERRAQLLREVKQAAEESNVAIQQALTNQVGRAGDRINRVREQEAAKEKRAIEDRKRATKELESVESQLARGAQLNTKQRNALLERQAQLLRDISDANNRAAAANATQRLPNERLAVLAGISTGAEAALRRNNEFIERIRQEQIRLNAEGLKGFASSLSDVIVKLAKINQQLADVPEGSERHGKLKAQFNELLLQAEALEGVDPAALGIEGFETISDVAAKELAALPKLERLFIGAFDDMGRRFQTTLQFAISGALIFGVQQLARRFVETAIEVQRTFEDIGTAFEFDIDAERGTAEFRQELNGIRLQVLALADEFNVLPTEANKAAFSMVSRFGDANDALKALRAQLLATKISTIDQAEALRALSSVAENFAAASLFVADGASISEKLVQREAAAVLNYGKALDVATLLQQRFGVEVEDTLEGMSRLAPTFAKMGFTMEQTAAIVASISRELGQTGSSVADSVNRSLGQLVEPGIRDQLLNLAAASSNLTLTFEDFSNGERALSALVSQFRNLEEVDPATAFKVLNVIGQRRELDVVAALFNTTELQEAMVEALSGAAGAAEARFAVLAQTISERLASIGTGFERLAQNFSQLGLLTPLQLAVATFDELLQGANSFLETLTKIIAEMGIVGDVIKGALVFTFATSSLTRLAGLIAKTVSFGLGKVATGAGSKLGTAALGSVAAAQLTEGATKLGTIFKDLAAGAKGNRIGLFAMAGALRAATIELGRMAVASAANALNNSIPAGLNALATKFPKLGKSIDGLDGFLFRHKISYAKLAVGAGLVVGALVGAAFAIKGFESALDKVAKGARNLTNAQLSAAAQVRREKLEDPNAFATQADENRREAEIFLTNLQQQNAEIDGFFERLGLGIISTTETARAGQEELFRLIQENNAGRELTEAEHAQARSNDVATRVFVQSMAPNTPEFQAELERQGTRRFLREATAALLDSAIREGVEASIQAGARSGGSQLLDLDAFAPSLDPDEVDNAPAAFLRNVGQLMSDIQNATSDVQIANAQSALDTLMADYEELMHSLGGIEGTIESSQDDIARAQRDFSVGRIGNTEFIEQLKKIERDLRLRAAAQFGKDEEAAQESITLADQALLQIIQHQITVLDVDRSAAANLPSAAARLVAELDILERELKLIEETDVNAIALKLIEIAKVTQDLADAYRTQALSIANSRVAMARTSAQWFKAQEQLIRVLEKQLLDIALTWGADPAEIIAAQEALAAATNERADRLLDEAQRMAIATIRLSGPINDKMNQLAGQIKAVRLALAAEDDPLEALELQVQLRELLAQVLQEEIARMAAFVEVQAGVNDEITSLKGQITVAIQEIDAAAQIFGTTSTEFNRARASLANLKNQLAQALLSLDDMNRRLGSDLSNDFEQAILDLQLLAEKLQAPDLGDLERAQLTLEKARGEMAAERAFFSTELFNLRFLSETGAIGSGAYLSALKGLLSQVDTTTQQGKEIFLEIQGLIDGLTDDISDMAFNVPTAIRLPTLFEVRRALAADQLGVNYMDNRQMDITIDVRDATDVEALVSALANSLGGSITSTAGRFAPGASSLTLGGF